ncbi:MAG TPA: DUF1015 family protein [Verrucomicrobiota bacterium]|jgi:uncharacterized protein (DUF1015 family)|nr:DUF1015 family protein [Verrucomicrobiota bacterium]HQL79376.1 DUF1015 family protein [Verrucomicrobiota bacterium]
MAVIKPFAALRPKPDLAPRICELPYDVMSTEEARQAAAGNPLSFLHVSKPEIDLPPATDPCAPEVYARGRESFRSLIAQGALQQDAQPCFYLYRQIMGAHRQTGLVATASCADYLEGVIKKHELTRPDKEDDRLRHIQTLESQTGPVFLVYRATPGMDALVARQTAEAPSVDFTAPDGVRHTAWVIAEAAQIRMIEAEFGRMPGLYIADGHHRCAAAARLCQARHGAGESARFLSVIFPHNQMQILPYNRVLKDLNGLSPGQLLEKLAAVFTIKTPGGATPTRKHELGLYLADGSADFQSALGGRRAKRPAGTNEPSKPTESRRSGRWHTLSFLPHLTAAPTPIERLDVTLLQKHVLEPVFGISDPRTSQRINFVGGIRGTAELEKLVNSGEYACAFSMFPTSIEDLMTIADAGGIMPPKSTWFEPKLRDAMFCHLI